MGWGGRGGGSCYFVCLLLVFRLWVLFLAGGWGGGGDLEQGLLRAIKLISKCTV